MNISIITPDFSSNSTARAYIFAKALKENHQVEIIGFKKKKKIWPPLLNENGGINFKVFDGQNLINLHKNIPAFLKSMKGDILIVNTPLPSSFNLALLKKFMSNKKLILDMADWELGFKLYQKQKSNFLKFMIKESSNFLRNVYSYWGIKFNESVLTEFVDRITVSNSFLKNKFGGTIIRHCRDTDYLNPKKFSRRNMRKKLGIKTDQKVVIFLGTPRPYKGIDLLIDAIYELRNKKITLLIVGMSNSSYCEEIDKKANKFIPHSFQSLPMQPFKNIPYFLSASDLVVIPQKETIATKGQMPAKVFDAMAMGKPIIATNVGDLKKVLGGCGWIIDPDDVKSLQKQINFVLNHPQIAENVGQKARNKCIKNYSLNSLNKKLNKIIQDINDYE